MTTIDHDSYSYYSELRHLQLGRWDESVALSIIGDPEFHQVLHDLEALMREVAATLAA